MLIIKYAPVKFCPHKIKVFLIIGLIILNMEIAVDILEKTLHSIKPVSQSAGERMKTVWDSLAHPPGSLGELEDMTVKLAKIQNTTDLKLDKKITAVFCADNGVYEEHLTSQPQITTFLLAELMHTGKTGLGAISKWAESEIAVYDVGMMKTSLHKDIFNKKLRCTSGNIVCGAAMSRMECTAIMEAGIEAAQKIAADGYGIAGIGELGICNTTTTAAVLSALSGAAPEKTVGRGASTTEDMYKLKIKTVEKALELNKPDSGDPVDCIAKVGGFDIAAMCGCYIGLASCGLPAVIDGYISGTAALCAVRLNPLIKDYMFASHFSNEPGARICTELIGLKPVLDMRMRLGEGSGCPLFFKMLEGAIFINKNMGKFSGTPIAQSDLVDIRK